MIADVKAAHHSTKQFTDRHRTSAVGAVIHVNSTTRFLRVLTKPWRKWAPACCFKRQGNGRVTVIFSGRSRLAGASAAAIIPSTLSGGCSAQTQRKQVRAADCLLQNGFFPLRKAPGGYGCSVLSFWPCFRPHRATPLPNIPDGGSFGKT